MILVCYVSSIIIDCITLLFNDIKVIIVIMMHFFIQTNLIKWILIKEFI